MGDPKLARMLRAVGHDSMSPLREELERIRGLLEDRTRAAAAAAAADTPASPPPSSPETAPHAALRTSTKRSEAAERAARRRRELQLLRQLLADYPADAAAVYFAFERQRRCAPEHLDRLVRGTDLAAAWAAANRASIRSLAERYHGGLNMVAELLGRDSDGLAVLLLRLDLEGETAAIRARERQRIEAASLGQRLHLVLSREKLLRDLGILAAVDERTRHEVQARCAGLSGECADAAAVLRRIGVEFGLDDAGLERLERRYDLVRFTADLYQQPFDARRAAPRPSAAAGREARPPLQDAEIEARILRMLLAKGKVGASHTHIAHLIRTVPRHERGRARDIVQRLVNEGILVLKTTDNSAEPHVSIAVAAIPQIELLVGPGSQ